MEYETSQVSQTPTIFSGLRNTDHFADIPMASTTLENHPYSTPSSNGMQKPLPESCGRDKLKRLGSPSSSRIPTGKMKTTAPFSLSSWTDLIGRAICWH